MSDDLISRQAVIGIVEFECGEWKGLARTIVKEIDQLPSAEKTAEWEWCHDCKEYDQENHCCHRYTSFIRETLQDSINAVLEDIKEEMEKEQDEVPYPLDIEHAIAIIEKHISGKEKE